MTEKLRAEMTDNRGTFYSDEKGTKKIDVDSDHENVLICGSVGVGKAYLANALGGHTAVKRGLTVVMLRAQTLLKRLHRSRADNSFGKELVRLIRPRSSSSTTLASSA